MTLATKTVKGKKYLYFTYYNKQAGTKKEVYCGLDADSKAKRKALELELGYLEDQTNELSKKKEEVEKALEHWVNIESTKIARGKK